MADRPTDALLPCPFCGGRAEWMHANHLIGHATCTVCGAAALSIVEEATDDADIVLVARAYLAAAERVKILEGALTNIADESDEEVIRKYARAALENRND